MATKETRALDILNDRRIIAVKHNERGIWAHVRGDRHHDRQPQLYHAKVEVIGDRYVHSCDCPAVKECCHSIAALIVWDTLYPRREI